jgi:hypothetical protein
MRGGRGEERSNFKIFTYQIRDFWPSGSEREGSKLSGSNHEGPNRTSTLPPECLEIKQVYSGVYPHPLTRDAQPTLRWPPCIQPLCGVLKQQPTPRRTGVCAILLRLHTSTERLKRVYTSPGSLLKIDYFTYVMVLIIIYNFYFYSFYLKHT